MAQQQVFDATCGTSTPTTQSSVTTDSPASQDACTNALTTLTNNIASCTLTSQNPSIICSGECRDYYDDVFENCSPAVSLVIYIQLCECCVCTYIRR